MPYFPQFLATKSLTPEEDAPSLSKLAASVGIVKDATNKFVLPAKQDFWEVRGEKIIRKSSEEVDLGESLVAPSAEEDPSVFLSSLLDNLDL